MDDYVLYPETCHDAVVLVDRNAQAQTGAGRVSVKTIHGHQRGCIKRAFIEIEPSSYAITGEIGVGIRQRVSLVDATRVDHEIDEFPCAEYVVLSNRAAQYQPLHIGIA